MNGSRALKTVQRLFGLFLIAGIAAELLGWRIPRVTGQGKPLMDAILASGYVFATIRVVNVLSGAAMLLDRFAALGAVVLFPISLNILLFHGVLNPSGLPQASVFFAFSCVALYVNRAAYKPLLRARPEHG